MRILKGISLRTKMLIQILAGVILVYAVIITIISVSARKNAANNAVTLANAESARIANGVRSILSVDFGVAKAFSSTFGGWMYLGDDYDRYFKRQIASVSRSQPRYVQVWYTLLENKVNPEWKGSPYARKKYISRRDRENFADIDVEFINPEIPSEYILQVERNFQPLLTEPFKIEGRDDHVFSIMFHTQASRVLQGTVGIDISLDSLNVMRAASTGQNRLSVMVTDKATITGFNDSDYIGDKLFTLFPDLDKEEIMESIEAGTGFSFTHDYNGESYFFSASRYNVGYATNWQYLIAGLKWKDINADAVQLTRRALIYGLIGIIGIVIMLIFISKIIVNPIIYSTEKTKKIEQGDLSVHIDKEKYDSGDEVDTMVHSLANMALRLKHIVQNVRDSSDDVTNTAVDLRKKSEELSSSVTQMASSSEEVSSVIEELSANIQQNRDHAIKTEEMSKKALTSVESGNKETQNVRQAMHDINEKISIVRDIAFQTNILALNAAVEAARAGDSGRGFSVVAAEVRNLAEKSKVAAIEIEDLIAKTLEESELAGEQLMAVVPEFKETTQLVSEIKVASIEQSQGLEQIATAISELNITTQQNSAMSQELQAGAQLLEKNASNMQNEMAYFKVRKG